MKQRKYNMGLVVKGKQTDFVNLQIRKITIPLTRLILKYTNISPNQVSYVGLVFTILTLLFFIQGGYWNFIFGSIFLFLVSIADHLDGKMARALNKPSLYGAWLDGMMDIVFLPLLMEVFLLD